ncbi:MAG TPA: YihY/virulence factor BrkB family protein, partial [Pseudolabrys sp.]|nr:YihY/virulence factor BrkB family protein [Pseudolabrys sp.]
MEGGEKRLQSVEADKAGQAVVGRGPMWRWGFWKGVLYRIYNEIVNDRLLALAAGVTFYVLLAIVPAITALVSIYALIADPSAVQNEVSSLQNLMPSGSFQIVQQQVNRIVSSNSGSLSLWFFVSLAIALWSANSGLKAIIDALNIVFDVEEKRSFIRLNLVSLAMTLAGVVGIILAMAGLVAVPIAISYVPVGSFGQTLASWARWPALLVLLMVALAVLYRFGPDREHPRWEWVSPGNLFAAVAWLVGSALLSWYFSNFANYDATYGSLGGVIGLMIWLWVTATVVLVGAEINSEYYAAKSQTPRKARRNKIGGLSR